MMLIPNTHIHTHCHTQDTLLLPSFPPPSLLSSFPPFLLSFRLSAHVVVWHGTRSKKCQWHLKFLDTSLHCVYHTEGVPCQIKCKTLGASGACHRCIGKYCTRVHRSFTKVHVRMAKSLVSDIAAWEIKRRQRSGQKVKVDPVNRPSCNFWCVHGARNGLNMVGISQIYWHVCLVFTLYSWTQYC